MVVVPSHSPEDRTVTRMRVERFLPLVPLPPGLGHSLKSAGGAGIAARTPSETPHRRLPPVTSKALVPALPPQIARRAAPLPPTPHPRAHHVTSEGAGLGHLLMPAGPGR